MTNEEAMLYLENALCELDAGIKVYRGTVKEEFIEQRKCFTVALSALREQAERGKGCNWCIGFCPDVTGDIYADYHFCPMCGRRLGAQQ